MNLYLLRHGQAEAAVANDAGRRLTGEGSRQNHALAEQFLTRGPTVDLALVSPYWRAQQTAADLQSVFGNLEFQESELITPDADPRGLIQFLDQGRVENVLLVSHNPLLSRLWSLLEQGVSQPQRYLQTSELICLTLDVVAPGCARTGYILSPD